MTFASVLTGAGLVLRPPKPRDRAARLALGRVPEISSMFGADPAEAGPLTQAEVTEWLDKIAASPTAWVIEHQGRFLGDIRLRGLNPRDRNAWLGIGLYDPACIGRGIGRAAIRLLMPHAFGTMGLHRLTLRVLAFNTRAIRCYSACGFVQEGRERENAFLSGQWQDDVMMGCLAHEARLAD